MPLLAGRIPASNCNHYTNQAKRLMVACSCYNCREGREAPTWLSK